MERKNKACWNCKHYDAYYTKGICTFTKQAKGRCTKLNEDTGNHGNCELWSSNDTRSHLRKKVSLKKIEAALEELAGLKQILLEELEREEGE